MRHSVRRSHAVTAAAAGVMLVLAGCAGAEESTDGATGDAAAEQVESDGELTVYSGRSEELVAPLIEQFEQDSGLEVEVRYASTSEQAALLLEEGENTPAQVFLSQDAGALGALAKEGLLGQLPADVADAVPAGFTSEDGSWVGITGRARVIAYDGQELTEQDVPTEVAALTDPEWSGRVGIAPTNASFQSFVTAMRVVQGEDVAQEWLADMAANDVQRFESNGDILAAVDSGQLDLGLLNHYYWFEAAAEIGPENMRAQLSYPTPGDPGALVNVTGAGILAGAEQDPDALEFVQYLIGTDAQTYFVENTFEYPLVEGIDPPEGLPELDSLVNPELDLSDLDTLAETTELISAAGLT